MSDPDHSPLLAILRHCAEAAPQPWYPSVHARQAGVERDSLDPHLDRLRLGGLIQLTDWVQGTGQGYRLTPDGERALNNPRDLDLLKDGKLPALHTADSEAVTAGAPRMTTFERGETVRAALLDAPAPLVTRALLVVNVGVFLYGLALANGQHLIKDFINGFGNDRLWSIQHETGAVTGLDIVQGQWWRLLSCCFVHFGLLHLVVNMYTLYALGPAVEQMWGRWRFLFIYLVAGVGGSCAAMWMHPESRLAGASGALWGVMTSYAAWIFLNRHYLPGPISAGWLRQLLSVFLINVFISMMPVVSASAHFAGGFVGLVAAVLANTQRFASGRLLRWGALLGLLLLPALCVGGLVREKAHDSRWQELEYQAFDLRFQRSGLQEVLDRPLALYNGAVKRVIERHPERRDAAEVAQAVRAVADFRDRLTELRQLLDDAGPYGEPVVANALRAARADLASAIEFYRLADRCLQPDDDWKQHDRALAQQQRQVQERVADWKASWAEFRRSRQQLQRAPGAG